MLPTISRVFLIAVLAAVSLSGSTATACGDYRDYAMYSLIPKTISENAEEADKAIAAMRAHGERALPLALSSLDRVLAETGEDGKPTARALGARRAIDKIAAQKDAQASRLFWFTDLDAAKAASATSGRPILSLRLLGRLDEDLSCANSRFFRTALYANTELSKYLRKNFVLHWKSVRPVPVITIDFGDGRKICRTITGNSIHYVLDAKGRVVDALPGLYGPEAFRTALDRAAGAEKEMRPVEGDAHRLALASWHAREGARVDAAFAADLAKIGDGRSRLRLMVAGLAAADGERKPPPSALRAASVARGKMMAEAPVVRAIQPKAVDLVKDTDDETWAKIAKLHASEAVLDSSSAALMRTKVLGAERASELAESKRRVEDPALKMIRNFERSMAEDTVRNEYDLHRTLHRWFQQGAVGTVDELNERVYDKLFLTPSSDPWLGLLPADTYAALDGEGVSR